MFPYLDSVARRYPPVIVWAVIGMSVLAFLYQTSLPPRVLDRFLFEFALVPSRFFGQLSLVAPSDWTPFLTNIFLHGGWLHLILNMWTLWIFGPAVEDRLGPGRFTLFYLFCGVAAGLAHALATPHSVVPALGALACPQLVARFKSNAWLAWRPWLMGAAHPARAGLAAPAACTRGSSAGVVYYNAAASIR